MWVLPHTGARPAASARSWAPGNLDGLSGEGLVPHLPLLLPDMFTVCQCSSFGFVKMSVCICGCRVCFAAPGPSRVAENGAAPDLWRTGFLLQSLLLWPSTGSRARPSAVATCGLCGWAPGSELRLSRCSQTVVLQPVESSRTRDQTRAYRTGKRILHH